MGWKYEEVENHVQGIGFWYIRSAIAAKVEEVYVNDLTATGEELEEFTKHDKVLNCFLSFF